MSFAPFRTQAHSSAIFFLHLLFHSFLLPFCSCEKKIGVTAAAADDDAAAAASNISERTWEEAEDREASAKERRCQVKFALTEEERRASSCLRRRTQYEMRNGGGLLKNFAAVNITRGEKKKDFFCRCCLRILYARIRN